MQCQWTGKRMEIKMKVIVCHQMTMSFNLPALSGGNPFISWPNIIWTMVFIIYLHWINFRFPPCTYIWPIFSPPLFRFVPSLIETQYLTIKTSDSRHNYLLHLLQWKKDRHYKSIGFLPSCTHFKWMKSLFCCSNPARSECYRLFCKTNSFYFPFYFY